MLISKKSDTTDLFGLRFFNQSKSKLKDLYVSRIIKNSQPQQPRPFFIFTPNPEQIILAQQDLAFRAALQRADLLIPDGIGVVLASRVLAKFKNIAPIQQRVTGIDLLQEILDAFPTTSYVVIGGHSENSKLNSEEFLTYKSQEIPWLPGYQNIQHPTTTEEKIMVQFLKKHRPTVVFVAFGAPYQEFWSLRHRAILRQSGVRLVLVVGGTVDVLSGKLSRAPRVFQQLGMEWLFRLLQEPWRWRRQLRLVQFAQLTLRQIVQ